MSREEQQIARKIRGARISMGLSQAEFARRLGVSARAVQSWEAGLHYPFGKQLRKLADISGFPLETFVGEKEAEGADQKIAPKPPTVEFREEGEGLEKVESIEKLIAIRSINPELYRSIMVIVSFVYESLKMRD